MVQRGLTYAFQLASILLIGLAGFKLSGRALNGDGNPEIAQSALPLALNYQGSKIHVPEFLRDIEVYGQTITQHVEHMELLVDILNGNTYEDKQAIKNQIEIFGAELKYSLYFDNIIVHKYGEFYMLEIDFIELKKSDNKIKADEVKPEKSGQGKPRYAERFVA